MQGRDWELTDEQRDDIFEEDSARRQVHVAERY